MRKRLSLSAILVHPSTGGTAANTASLASTEHLGISYLAAALEQASIPAAVIDFQADPAQMETFEEALAGRPAVLGLSPTSRSFPHTCELAHRAKEISPHTAVVIGGHLASALGADVFSLCPEIDIVYIGLAEAGIGTLVTGLATRHEVPQSPHFAVSAGSPYAAGPELTGKGPAWTELMPARRASGSVYASYGARVVATLGCPFDCNFCTTPDFFGRALSRRTVSHVLAEVDLLVDLYGVSRLWFNDDLFVTSAPSSRAWVTELSTRIREKHPGIRFRPMVRADTFAREPQLLDMLVASGMDTVFVGIESGTNAGLNALNKRTSIDTNRWVIEALDNRGVLLQAGFIMYGPSDTVGTIRASARFLQETGLLHRFFPLTRSVSIFPGTALWRASGRSGAWDHERSTAVERYPAFASCEVRELARAWAILEEQLSALDGAMNRRRREMTLAQRQAAGATILDVFLESVSMAEKGATTSFIVKEVALAVAALTGSGNIHFSL